MRAVAQAFREEWGRVLATLIRTLGDWDLAEECTQEAFAQAVKVWPRDGIPRRPGAWLTTVARNRGLDRLRRRTSEAAKLEEVATLSRDNEFEASGTSAATSRATSAATATSRTTGCG